MKTLYYCRYRFNKPALPPQKILAISDVHFVDELTKKHQRALDFAKETSPNLIVVTGDIIDNIHVLKNTENKKVLKNWFEQLGKIAPVCISLGNHDSYREKSGKPTKVGFRKYHYISDQKSPLPEYLANIPNVYLLDNNFYEDKSNFVFGLSLPPDYYDTPAHPGTEDRKVLLETLRKNADHFKKMPANKTKILLVHSPIYMTDPDVREYLDEFDFILAGHMHNGVVPPVLQEIWPGHRGIFTANKRLFANQNTRLGLYDNKFIALGAIITMPDKKLDALFPTNVATIETGHNKLSIRRKYLK